MHVRYKLQVGWITDMKSLLFDWYVLPSKYLAGCRISATYYSNSSAWKLKRQNEVNLNDACLSVLTTITFTQPILTLEYVRTMCTKTFYWMHHHINYLLTFLPIHHLIHSSRKLHPSFFPTFISNQFSVSSIYINYLSVENILSQFLV